MSTRNSCLIESWNAILLCSCMRLGRNRHAFEKPNLSFVNINQTMKALDISLMEKINQKQAYMQ